MKFNPQGGASVLASRLPKTSTSARGDSRPTSAREDARPTRLILLFVVVMSLFVAFGAFAATTNGLSNAEIAGHKLVQQILEMRPTENVTNRGFVYVNQPKRPRMISKIEFEINVTPTNWTSIYRAITPGHNLEIDQKIFIAHSQTPPGQFYSMSTIRSGGIDAPLTNFDNLISGENRMMPFANSDFSVADLGLEFFHWPQQKVLRKEFRRSCGCSVLESVNPNPTTNGYSRVVTWIDNESLGIVQAEAYDSKNKLLKEFYPKDIKKMNGQWQVQTLDISNRQTGSNTRLEFDLDGK